jgi:ABC-type uncharacterized transport system permease subunit
MLSGVSIICFAGSYTVALALEVSRLLFRSGVRGAVMLGFAAAGLVAHSAFLYHQAVKTTGSPLSSERDWYLVAAWVLVVVYLYLVWFDPRVAFGLLLLPLVLGLVAAGALADETPFERGRAAGIWGAVHGMSILLAAVSVLVGFAAGLMYLGQARRLKHKRPPVQGLRLPSLEWLRRVNSRAMVAAVLTLGIGVLSGIILGRVRAADLSWADPIVLSTSAMFAWLLVATVFGGLYRPAQKGRKVAYLTVVSFVFLLIVLGVFLAREHGRGGRSGFGTAAAGSEVHVDAAGREIPTTTTGGPQRQANLAARFVSHPSAFRLPPSPFRLPPSLHSPSTSLSTSSLT